MTTKAEKTEGRVFASLKPDFRSMEEIGDSIEGWIVRFDVVTIGGREVKRMVLKGDDSKLLVTLMTAQMEACLSDSNVGHYIRITYRGEVKTRSGFKVKDLDIEIAES